MDRAVTHGHQARGDIGGRREPCPFPLPVKSPDFEKNTASLRDAANRRIVVTFGPDMANDVHAALRRQAGLEGTVAYDHHTREAKRVRLRRVQRGGSSRSEIPKHSGRRRRSRAYRRSRASAVSSRISTQSSFRV